MRNGSSGAPASTQESHKRAAAVAWHLQRVRVPGRLRQQGSGSDACALLGPALGTKHMLGMELTAVAVVLPHEWQIYVVVILPALVTWLALVAAEALCGAALELLVRPRRSTGGCPSREPPIVCTGQPQQAWRATSQQLLPSTQRLSTSTSVITSTTFELSFFLSLIPGPSVATKPTGGQRTGAHLLGEPGVRHQVEIGRRGRDTRGAGGGLVVQGGHRQVQVVQGGQDAGRQVLQPREQRRVRRGIPRPRALRQSVHRPGDRAQSGPETALWGAARRTSWADCGGGRGAVAGRPAVWARVRTLLVYLLPLLATVVWHAPDLVLFFTLH